MKRTTQYRLSAMSAVARTAIVTLTASVPMALVGSGCEQPQGIAVVDGDDELAKGLTTFNGIRSRNGLDLFSALEKASTLAATSTLMSSSDGRKQIAYLVKCALPMDRKIVKTDRRGNKYTFHGSIGLAPEWETGMCGQGCQEWISACLIALTNTTGDSVPLWMAAEHPSVGFGRAVDYPVQEGSFFGNIFSETPTAKYCRGRDFLTSPVPGRIGSTQVDPTLVNAFGKTGTCANNCAAADYPSAGDGYKSCAGWNRVITIWRQPASSRNDNDNDDDDDRR